MRLSNIALAISALYGGLFTPAGLFAGGVNGVWYDPSDLTTLFTTSAGTTQCAMPGQGSAVSVGLMLDKSQNGVGTNGAARYNVLIGTNLLESGWTGFNASRATVSIATPIGTTSASRIAVSSTSASEKVWFINSAPSVAAAPHVASIYAKAETLSWIYLRCDNGTAAGVYFNLSGSGTVGTADGGAVGTIQALADGWYRCTVTRTLSAGGGYGAVQLATGDGVKSFTGTTNDSVLVCGADLRLASQAALFPTYQRIDANWYSTMAGNHAIAFNNTTARPELRARVNLLTYSEDFSNAAWTKSGLNAFGSGSVANTTATLDPLGGNTADFIQENTANSTHEASQIFSVGSSVRYSYAVYVKAAGRNWCQFVLGPSTHFGTGGISAYFDLANGAVGTVTSNPTALPVATIQSVGNGWYLCALSATSNAAVGTADCYVRIAQNGSTVSYTGDGTSGIYIWGADLRPANIGANVPAYQRIADANTYDTSGFPLYLRFDGIDDSMYTPANLNLSGTDKVAVFAGVRKNADVSIVAELSANASSNNGAFLLATGGWATENGTYVRSSRGTATSFAQPATNSYPSPQTNVLTGTSDIAGDSVVLRINGTQVATSATDQGSGNYGTYPLYIGSRNNSSLWFNGHLYSLAVVGSAVSAGNIAAMESWVAGRTGIAI